MFPASGGEVIDEFYFLNVGGQVDYWLASTVSLSFPPFTHVFQISLPSDLY
jgi:hypothetical protein